MDQPFVLEESKHSLLHAMSGAVKWRGVVMIERTAQALIDPETQVRCRSARTSEFAGRRLIVCTFPYKQVKHLFTGESAHLNWVCVWAELRGESIQITEEKA